MLRHKFLFIQKNINIRYANFTRLKPIIITIHLRIGISAMLYFNIRYMRPVFYSVLMNPGVNKIIKIRYKHMSGIR